MLNLTLRHKAAPSYRSITIEFPALPDGLQQAMDSIGVGITTEKLCLVDAVQGESGALRSMVGTLVNADEIQYLAQRMDSFDKNELNTFYAAVILEKLVELKDLINLTFNLHCYALISDFSDIATIGEKYELCRRMAMTSDEMRRTDFAAIGRQLLKCNSGAVTPYGVLYRTENTAEQVYNGKQFPEYHWRDDDVATVTVETCDCGHDVKREYLYLPCCEIEITKAINRLEVQSPESCSMHLACEAMNDPILHIFSEDLLEHLTTMNGMARCYAGFDEQAKEAFHAIVDMVGPNTPEDVVLLGENFYEFMVIPRIKSAAEYGRHMIADSEHFNCNPSLEKYVDFKGYGEQCIQRENGHFTDYGYIAYLGTSPAVAELIKGNQAQGMCLQ